MEFFVTIRLKIVFEDHECGPREEELKYLETCDDAEIWELSSNYSRTIE